MTPLSGLALRMRWTCLDEALAHPWSGFEISRDAPEDVPNTQAKRVLLRLDYMRRS